MRTRLNFKVEANCTEKWKMKDSKTYTWIMSGTLKSSKNMLFLFYEIHPLIVS